MDLCCMERVMKGRGSSPEQSFSCLDFWNRLHASIASFINIDTRPSKNKHSTFKRFWGSKSESDSKLLCFQSEVNKATQCLLFWISDRGEGERKVERERERAFLRFPSSFSLWWGRHIKWSVYSHQPQPSYSCLEKDKRTEEMSPTEIQLSAISK